MNPVNPWDADDIRRDGTAEAAQAAILIEALDHAAGLVANGYPIGEAAEEEDVPVGLLRAEVRARQGRRKK